MIVEHVINNCPNSRKAEYYRENKIDFVIPKIWIQTSMKYEGIFRKSLLFVELRWKVLFVTKIIFIRIDRDIICKKQQTQKTKPWKGFNKF